MVNKEGKIVQVPTWVASTLLGLLIAWMSWMSLQAVNQSGDMKEVKSRLNDISVAQARQDGVTTTLQVRIQEIDLRATTNTARLEALNEEIRAIREKVYVTKSDN